MACSMFFEAGCSGGLFLKYIQYYENGRAIYSDPNAFFDNKLKTKIYAIHVLLPLY